MSRVLVVDDEKILRFTFSEILEEGGYSAITAEDYDSAMEKIEGDGIDLIVTDIILGGKTGIDLLRKVRNMGLKCPVIVLTGYPDVDTAAEAVRLGAFDYLSKPVAQDKLLNSVRVALKYKDAVDREDRYRANLEAIYRSVEEGIVTVDDELKIIELNSAAETICGLSRKHIGRVYDSLKIDCSGSCIKALRDTVEGRKAIKRYRMACGRVSMKEQVVSITTSPLVGDEGNYAGAVMVITDESRLARLERDLKERRRYKNIIGESSRMQKVYSMIENLCDVDTSVLVSGESGTGKELVAEALHYGSARRQNGPLIFINCAAIPENLIESELFGHEKGSFTGAVSMQRGKFELASCGTIVLDEIGDMPLGMQAKLLRVLEQSEIRRVGGEKPIRTDVRVVASTNRELREKVSAGQFREDLYYRLKVVEINLPPLRERVADIKPLTRHFIDIFNERFGKEIRGVSDEVEEVLMSFRWPGNVRELEHVIEHAFIVCRSNVITAADLPEDMMLDDGQDKQLTAVEGGQGGDAGAIISALEKARWNKSEAAKLLGMDRSTLYRKMKVMKID